MNFNGSGAITKGEERQKDQAWRISFWPTTMNW